MYVCIHYILKINLVKKSIIKYGDYTINNISVQFNLMLEHGDLKLLQKRSKLVQCKPSQCNVTTCICQQKI